MLKTFEKTKYIHFDDILKRLIRSSAYTEAERLEAMSALCKDKEQIISYELNNYHSQTIHSGEFGCNMRVLDDYTYRTNKGNVLVNFGCCGFRLADIKKWDYEKIFEFVKNLDSKRYAREPLKVKQFAQMLLDKLNETTLNLQP